MRQLWFTAASQSPMLKVSNKGRYAVRALFDLAFHRAPEPAQLRDIAARQRIPLRFLEQIFHDLKRAGLVDSKRGPRGGYHLARAADAIRVGDVLRALDGPIALVSDPAARSPRTAQTPVATTRGAGASRSRRVESDLRRVTDRVFTELARDVERCFDAITLEDLCARSESLGVGRDARPLISTYVI